MKGFIGTGVNIAMYNLLEDEFEAHTLEDGKNAFIIEADEEKIDIWKNANDNNIVGFEVEDIVLNSIQIKFTKNRILEALRKKANEHIESEYPWHKQNNINELQGYMKFELFEKTIAFTIFVFITAENVFANNQKNNFNVVLPWKNHAAEY